MKLFHLNKTIIHNQNNMTVRDTINLLKTMANQVPGATSATNSGTTTKPPVVVKNKPPATPVKVTPTAQEKKAKKRK